jgi:hypothetical protein
MSPLLMVMALALDGHKCLRDEELEEDKEVEGEGLEACIGSHYDYNIDSPVMAMVMTHSGKKSLSMLSSSKMCFIFWWTWVRIPPPQRTARTTLCLKAEYCRTSRNFC